MAPRTPTQYTMSSLSATMSRDDKLSTLIQLLHILNSSEQCHQARFSRCGA